jgi:hypothetical protein
MGSYDAQFDKLFKIGNFLYAATATTASEVHIMDLTYEVYQVISGANLNITGNYRAINLYAYDNTLLVSDSNSAVHHYNITNRMSPVFNGSYSAGGQVNSIAVDQVRELAFLATSNASMDFQSVDISNSNSMVLYGYYNITATSTFNSLVYDSLIDRNFIGLSLTID